MSSTDHPQERQEGEERFFSVKQTEAEQKDGSLHSSLEESIASDDNNSKRCLTLRVLQHMLPCIRRKGVWEPSQGDVFKSHDSEEAKYPRSLRILESRVLDIIFVFSCLLSIFLFLFSEGFLIESRLLWGIIHLVNAVYAMGLFSQWLQILIKSKYAKTNHGYTTTDIVYTLLSVFPADLIMLAIYTLNDVDDNDETSTNPIEHWMITVSRLNYFLRIRSILQYFSKWEDHLVVGDFRMFVLRSCLFSTFFWHMFACIWHRLACNSFRLKHFLMTPDEATVEVCSSSSWLGLLKMNNPSPLLDHPSWHVLATHYLVSMYWTIVATFRLGACDIKTSLISNSELALVVITQMTAWIYILANVNGTLTSLLIEKDTEKQNFLNRLFAIRNYLQFGTVSHAIQDDVTKFYNYLWEKSRGIRNLDLVDVMPHAMKSEVYYDVNKFCLDQLPMLKGLETPFLMTLSVHTNHKFCLSGETLFKKNFTAQAMYYLVKGHLEILSDDEKHVIATIRSGSAIGEVHLVQPYPHVATVRCGSDCDILMLSRKHFKRVLNIYPQYISVLEQRLENRLEQSSLLLALCEKHNTYHKAFKALHDFQEQENVAFGDIHSSEKGPMFENVTKILDSTVVYEDVKSSRASDDFDGLEVGKELEANLSQEPRVERKGYEEMWAAAYTALEEDVARAGSLASDLNIPRPPLTVTAPETSTHVTLGFHQAASENIFVAFFKRLKVPTKGPRHRAWKFVVALSALLVFWYYPYQFAFRDLDHITLDYVAHGMDLIFALDCVYDMIQIVVTPQKTFESSKEITLYRLKSVYFYVRVLSFIPFEYMFAPLVGSGDDLSPYFYLFKFNRLLEIHLVAKFLRDFETTSRLPPILLFMGKFALGLFFVTHIFTVIYMFVLRDLQGTPTLYLHTFYWALVVVTSLGYGDMRSETNAEVAVETFGLITGVSTLIYMGAKVSSILVNAERRRMFYKQTYYGLLAFMNQKKFPKPLWNRVCRYYDLQWYSHEGTLIPTGKPVIWDAPRSLVTSVSNAHAHKFIARIPLFMQLPLDIQNEICVALKSYVIPPGEVVLYANELVQELYIISKGSCEVIHKGKQIAIFSEGRYFGMNGFLRGVNTDYKFRTLTHCLMFCLTREKFMKVAQSNPQLMREFSILMGETILAPVKTKKTLEKKKSEISYPPPGFIEDLVAASPDEVHPEMEMDSNDVPTFIKNLKTKLKAQCSNFYFLPNGSGLKWWLGFRITVAVGVTMYAPVQAFFTASPPIAHIVIVIFDVVAWIDILISLRIAYFGQENQLVTNSRRMTLHYLGGPFLIDIIACFPADYFMYYYLLAMGDPEYNNQYHIVTLLRLNRMLQCYKLFLMGKLLDKSVFKSLTLIMLLKMIPLIVLFINTATCLSVLFVCGVSRDGKPIKCKPSAWILVGMQNLDYTGTLSEENTVLIDGFREYVIALYWVAQSIYSVGFGDIQIGSNHVNQRVAIAVIFFGVMVASFAAGKITSCIVGEDPARTELQEKMKLMNEYLEQHRVSRSARRRVKETYFSTWDKTKGVSPKHLFIALPPTLKTDVMKQLYEPTLRTSPLFQDLDAPGLRMLATSLTEVFYPEGEFLMKFGDLNTDVFFIAQGAVVCYNVRGDIMSQMGSGSIIGEITTFFLTHRLYTAIAIKDVNAFVFKKEPFIAFLEQYPHIKTVLEACSVKHYKEAMMGSKRYGGVDFDVLLSFQNEVNPATFSMGAGPTRLAVPGSSPAPGSSPSIGEKSSFAKDGTTKFYEDNVGPEGDVTRIPLGDEGVKSPEDLSKASTETWWHVFVTFGRMARDEMGLVHVYQEPGQCNIFTFTIHPASPVCSWVSFCLVLTALSCSLTAYEIAFSKGLGGESALVLLSYVLELFFVIRFIGNFHLGYYDSTATLITDVKTISKRYMAKPDGMWLDFITTFPFYLLAAILPGVKAAYVRSLQLLRVSLFVRYLNEADTDLKMKAARAKILKITILLCFIFHFWACTWYLIACYEESCSRGSWMHKTLTDLSVSSGLNKDNITQASMYLLSLYYATNALTFTGFSEITARTNSELLITIIMIFVTAFLVGFLVGEMTQSLASQVATKIHYQHQLSVLESHFLTLGLSYTKIAEVRHYFKLLWCRCKGVMLFNLMEELPYPLRADVALEIYGPNLKSSRILGRLDENLIRQITARIHHEIYFPGSHIVRAGDVCTSMYFIKKGEVVILDDNNANLELCVEILYENECFGEVKILLPREQYRFSYVARLESEVGVLHKEDLEDVLKNHPKIAEDLKDKASRLKNRRQSLKEDEDRGILHGATSTLSIKSGISQSSKAQKDK